ncbi:hypothetical protein D3C84_541810 [compost metagenome]
MTRHLKSLEEKFALGSMSATYSTLHQARDELQRAAAQQVVAAESNQGLARHLQQTTGLLVGRQHIAVET